MRSGLLIERKQILEAELKKIVEAIAVKYSPEKIILFGSLVSGNVQIYSDIDLIVVKSTEKDPWERAEEVDRIVDHNMPIDILIYTPEEIQQRLLINDSFVKEFVDHGKVVYYEKKG